MFSFLFEGNKRDNEINKPTCVKCAYPVIHETIPKSTLGYAANNQYVGFPPKMQDARSIVGSWQKEAVINNELVKASGVSTNWQYRNFLINNADKIREYNTNEAFNDVGYYRRSVNLPLESKNILPYSKSTNNIFS
jgi:hypothetical protein